MIICSIDWCCVPKARLCVNVQHCSAQVNGIIHAAMHRMFKQVLSEPSTLLALQAELEDLCFAVVSPNEYRALRHELDRLWGLDSLPGIAYTEEAQKRADGAVSDATSHAQSDMPGSPIVSRSSETACSKVVQSPAGVHLRLAEKPAASSSAAATVLAPQRMAAQSDSRAAADIASTNTAGTSATRLAQQSIDTGSLASFGSSTSHEPPAAPSNAHTQDDRRGSNALASSSGRGMHEQQGTLAEAPQTQGSKIHRRRQLTSRKEHWAAKAAAAVVAEASRVGVGRDSAKRALRRPPSLQLTKEQLEVR